VKVAAKESILTPRFYTTDFDEMERWVQSDGQGSATGITFHPSQLIFLREPYCLLTCLLPPCCSRLFSAEINPNLDMDELESCLAEFRNDYNQKHFVRNDTFKV
jgi:magnesium-protoporphyrin IX monomethyl ester (oxidative) cyclase